MREKYTSLHSFFRTKRVLYPTPQPLPHTRSFWLAFALVALAALAFSAFFILYLTTRHDAFLTHAEDLGIMDQAIWNTAHGNLMHQTICNTIGDTNCVGLGGISRFSIHVEPILFIISLLYILVATPKLLLILQTLVIASGAFPAFWLARLRLRNEWAAGGIALLYLLAPAQIQANVFDFHAVTFTIAFLMFLFYFLYIRKTTWIFVFAILAMACKEEIPLIIALCGLWTALFQGRWRTGFGLGVLAVAWVLLDLEILHLVSPTGHSLLTSRYAYLGNSPIQIAKTILLHPVATIKDHVLESSHFFYIRTLFSPLAYLPLLAPWIMVLGLSTLALNLLSSDQQMYQGLFHYSAELAPILIFSTIEALAIILLCIGRIQASYTASRRRQQQQAATISATRPQLSLRTTLSVAQIGILLIATVALLGTTIRTDNLRGYLPTSAGFQWPQTSAHTALAESFIEQIPDDATVSAQSSLVPHISHRKTIYLFPYGDTIADFVFLDVTSDMYPFYDSTSYIREAKTLLLNGQYGIISARDGYLLLKRGMPSAGISPLSAEQLDNDGDPGLVLPNLPTSFCSFIVPKAKTIPHPVKIVFNRLADNTPTVELVGYQVDAPTTFSIQAGYMSVTTYWHVLTPTLLPAQLLVLAENKNGEFIASNDVPSMRWCQTNTWKPGMIVRLTTQVFSLRDTHIQPGEASISLAVIPLLQPSDKLGDAQARYPVSVVQAPATVHSDPHYRTVQLMPMKLVA